MSVIVIVEDNPNNGRLAKKILNKAGHTVILAEDGEIGLSSIFHHHPDLVMIDLGLPDMDGQTLVSILRQQDSLRNLPILIFTAYPEHAAHETARMYGCDGVIFKPIDTHSFAKQVSDYLPPQRTMG
jgi:two-component system, cell cycle response regulator DivK